MFVVTHEVYVIYKYSNVKECKLTDNWSHVN